MRCKECGHNREANEGSKCSWCGEWVCQYCEAFGTHEANCANDYEERRAPKRTAEDIIAAIRSL